MRLGKLERKEYAARPEDAGNNICGVLVHADPARFAQVRAALAASPGVEIHTETADGRLVLTVEDTDTTWASALIAEFHGIEGVLSVALAYHHFEPGNLEEEMPA